MRKRIAVIVAAVVAAFSIAPIANASAYLHEANAATTCYYAGLPSAGVQLSPYGGIGSLTSYWATRHSDNDISIDMLYDAKGDPKILQNNVYLFLGDRMNCRVQGNDPGTVVTLSDYGVAYRAPYF